MTLPRSTAGSLHKLKRIHDVDLRLHGYDSLEAIPADLLREAKRLGFSDFQIGRAIGMEKDHDMEEAITLVRRRRKALGIIPCVKQIDTRRRVSGTYQLPVPHIRRRGE